MQKLLLLLLLQGSILGVFAQGKTVSQPKQVKQDGKYTEEVAGVRGEPGYTWEGTYKNGRKEGIWIKTSAIGNIIAEETYKNNVLDGLAKYYYPNGKLSATGMFLSTEVQGQRDTIRVIDPVSGEETRTEVIRMGNSVRNGVWKLYDEETGKMFKEYYKRGDIVTPEELGEVPADEPAKPSGAQQHLPHETGGKKKKG